MFTHEYSIRAAEVDATGRAPLPVLLDLFQDIANRHAEELGWDMQTLLDRGEAWLMAQIAVERLEAPMPRAGETVRIETWPSHADRLYAMRDARLTTDAGDIAHVSSRWFVLDTATRRPRRVGSDFIDLVDASRPPRLDFPRLRWPADAAPEHAADLRVVRRDLDLNGHANNVAFARWALEALPPSTYEGGTLRRLDYAVRHEALWGQTVRAESLVQSDGAWLHRITRDGDELALVQSEWE